MSELLKRLQAELEKRQAELSGLPAKPTVDLLLGNDREIGRDKRSQEKRVGITPTHVKELKDFLSALGIGLNVFVMAGAGQRAGFPDSEYIRCGEKNLGEILTEEELENHDRPPDVFHALKEPSKYESRLPKPFCRIGAVHGGNFHDTSGLADLLATEDVAIFDGSNIGAPDAYRIPIRGRMSVFAGEIAAEWISEHLKKLDKRGDVVIVGGGRAGQAAARQLNAEPSVLKIYLFEDRSAEGRADLVRRDVQDLPKVEVLELEGRDHPELLLKLNRDCVAVLFAVARPGQEAPKVVHINHLLNSLSKDTIIVDISIDEKGAIFDPSVSPKWEAGRIIDHLKPSLGRKGIVYRAQENMPRSRAREASEAHGEVILPYIATLLYLAAWEDGAEGVRNFMAQQATNLRCGAPEDAPPGRLIEALIQDLRNGMAFYTYHGRIVVEEIVPDRVNLLSFLLRKEIPFEFSLPSYESLREKKHEKKRQETERALDLFSEDVREFLKFAFTQGVKGSVISHPKKDGTTTRGAAEALSAAPANVLKTLVWEKDGEFIATICSGVKHIDEQRLREVTGADTLQLAKRDKVIAATGHVPGAVPTIGLFKFKEDGIIKEVYLSEEVPELDYVYGSAGSVFVGFKFEPRYLIHGESGRPRLEAVKVSIARPDSLLFKNEKKINKLLKTILEAVARDDDHSVAEAAQAVKKLGSLISGDGHQLQPEELHGAYGGG